MVLLVVDVQELITTDKLFDHKDFITRLQKLIKSARENEKEVIYVRHDDGDGAALSPGKPGYDVAAEVYPTPDERIFDKKVNSPFKESGLLEYLKEKDAREIMVTGLQTEYCIDATVKTGFEHGFKVIVPAGCNTTTDNPYMSGEESYKYYNDFIWKNRYAQCLSFADALKLLGE